MGNSSQGPVFIDAMLQMPADDGLTLLPISECLVCPVVEH